MMKATFHSEHNQIRIMLWQLARLKILRPQRLLTFVERHGSIREKKKKRRHGSWEVLGLNSAFSLFINVSFYYLTYVSCIYSLQICEFSSPYIYKLYLYLLMCVSCVTSLKSQPLYWVKKKRTKNIMSIVLPKKNISVYSAIIVITMNLIF